MASLFLGVAAVMAFCGVIHSPLPDEQVGLPWHILAKVPEGMAKAVACQTPWHWAGAYLLSAGFVLLVGGRAEKENQPKKEEMITI
jgi:hypothetical protein